MKRFVVFILFVFLFALPQCLSAELLIKVGDSVNPADFKDSDIVDAVNDKRISLVNIGQFCNVKDAGLNGDGLRITGSILETFLIKTSTHKIERITHTSIRRTNLDTLVEDIISNTPNKQGEYMDVPLYIERRLNHSSHKIFGTTGNEYWYSGNSTTIAKLDEVWAVIETLTSNRKSDYLEFSWSDPTLKNYLVIKTDDMTDTERGEYVKPVVDINGDITAARKWSVDYEKDLALSPQEIVNIKNKNIKVDSRKSKNFSHVGIVKVKS